MNNLETRSVAFLLGAGASAEAGVLTSGQLTENVIQDINGYRQQYQWKSPINILNYIVSALMHHHAKWEGANPYDGLNIEEVVAACRLLAKKDESPAAPFVHAWDLPGGMWGAFIDEDHYRIAVESILAHVVKYLWIEQDAAVEYLVPLFDLCREGRTLTVFTLNYDNVFESACVKIGWSVDYVIPELHHLNIGSEREKCCLYKLHGSVDWINSSDDANGPRFLRLAPEAVRNGHDYDQSAGRNRVMIFGGGDKIRVSGPFLRLLVAFEDKLKEIDDLVVIGYSFGDAHINSLVKSWLLERPGKCLSVINPSDIANRIFSQELFLGYKDRVNLINEKASDAISHIGDLLRH